MSYKDIEGGIIGFWGPDAAPTTTHQDAARNWTKYISTTCRQWSYLPLQPMMAGWMVALCSMLGKGGVMLRLGCQTECADFPTVISALLPVGESLVLIRVSIIRWTLLLFGTVLLGTILVTSHQVTSWS